MKNSDFMTNNLKTNNFSSSTLVNIFVTYISKQTVCVAKLE